MILLQATATESGTIDELLYEGYFDLYEQLYDSILTDAGMLIADAQALCAIFMLIYFGIRLYPMITGDRNLEIMPLMRPFGIALVLMFWTQFVTIAMVPGDVITKTAKASFQNQTAEMKELGKQRFELADTIYQKTIQAAQEVERGENASAGWGYKIMDSMVGEALKNLAVLRIVVETKIQMLIARALEWICVSIFNVCVFIVFFLQVAVMTILVILGPFSFAASVIPVWSNAWASWCARFFSVSIWSGIAYIILKVVFKIVIWGLETEIAALRALLSQGSEVVAFVAASRSSESGLLIVSTLIGACMMFAIFPVSTWIIQTAGGGSLISSSANAAAVGAKTVAKVL